MTWTTSVAIIGNGPSALSLSYILNGHIPYYDPMPYGPHPDSILHNQLMKYMLGNSQGKTLLNAISDVEIIDYIKGSYESFFSETILPINLLLDSLCAADEVSFMNLESKECRIKWIYDPTTYVPHIVLGNSSKPGGQWGSDDFDSKDELSLSYAEMLSLPEYSFSQYYKDTYNKSPIDFYRPPRNQVADYYCVYPKKVGIESSIKSNVLVTCVDRVLHDGLFAISMRQNDGTNYQQKILTCQQVVLATGVYESPLETSNIIKDNGSRYRKEKTFYQLTSTLIHGRDNSIDKHHLSFTIIPPLSTPPCEGVKVNDTTNVTLVIGTGISAAEAINKSTSSKETSVIHVYKWHDDKGSPCVFRKYPKELYPDYVKVFHMMKNRKVEHVYEGLPNAQILDISPDGVVELELEDGSTIFRTVNCVKVCTGRTGSLAYLADTILDSESFTAITPVTKKTIREVFINRNQQSLRMSENVYAIGSLCGDTVVRFMLGSSLWVAGELIRSV